MLAIWMLTVQNYMKQLFLEAEKLMETKIILSKQFFN